ncbi:MAG TPA: DUF998 domain-containing protein [Pseudonocardia sp.]
MTIRPAESAEHPGRPVPAEPVASRTLPVVGLALVGLGLVLILLLHLLPPSDRVNPLTRTISEYALGANGWMFNVAVVSLALGSTALLTALARVGVVGSVSPASLLVGGWVAGLLVLVVFQKYDYGRDAGIGAGGMIHRMASLVAFLCLPAGALLLARAGRRNARWRRPATLTRNAALLAVACLGLLFYAVGQSFVTGVAWWRVFPLGAMERLIGLAEVSVLIAMGVWAITARGSAPADPVSDGGGRAPLVQ